MLARRLLMVAGGAGSFAPPISTSLFAMFNGQNGSGEYHVGQASSTDTGATWTEDAGNPVLSKSGAGWVSGHVKDPTVLSNGLVAYVSGYNGTYYQIGRVTRPNTSSTAWAYDSTTTPTIALGAGGSVDEHGCFFPTVWDDGSGTKRYKMWYAGTDASGNVTVCYAYSADGTTWTKVGRVISTGAGGSWYAAGVAPGAIAKSGSTYYLLVQGRKNASAPVHWQGGCWTFTDPEGTYTAAAGNPTLVAGFNTSGMSQSLTADVTAGTAVCHVADTSHWTSGMPMMIVDGSGLVESEYHTIASVDSGTQVTLASNVVATMHGSGGVLRPFWEDSVTPRSIVTLGGAIYAFCSPFQPLDDLSVFGETLWEGSMRATASAYDGTWTLDNANHLLLPLSPGSTGWHKYSAENPSVIVTP